eukprot:CAMPEP_0172589960 /NCGR_PEP_ID=MMETSP1068-20121228/8474_1 /TAXON_ID=35684 /ORGANISM="Pseudopedinella elastica, Strain CCMP716" /LENGTH=99 /DNA_ID=CAMNT_0013385633 /DNA_START=204 /DNA_END=500 /DNA_ORIENTATION=-
MPAAEKRWMNDGAFFLSPYKLRRLFKLQAPYPVLLARGWVQKMAPIECLLCLLCFVGVASVTLKRGAASDDLLEDDDHVEIFGLDLTAGGIKVHDSMKW